MKKGYVNRRVWELSAKDFIPYLWGSKEEMDSEQDIMAVTVIETEKLERAIRLLKNYEYFELVRTAINILEGKDVVDKTKTD